METIWKYCCWPKKDNPVWCGENKCHKCKLNTIQEVEANGCGHWLRYTANMPWPVRENRMADNPGKIEDSLYMKRVKEYSQDNEDRRFFDLLNYAKNIVIEYNDPVIILWEDNQGDKV